MHTDGQQLGLAITAYKESRKPGRLEQALLIALDDRISEIVISDDGSDDWPELAARVDKLKREWRPDVGAKLKLIRQPDNLGVFGNKLAAMRTSTTDWVQSLDSDNRIDVHYLTSLEPLLAENRPGRMLCPSFASPHFDYCEQAGKTVTLANFESYLDWPLFSCFMNTGNQCFHRQTMLDVLQDVPIARYDRSGPDYFGPELNISDNDHRLVYDSADSFCFNKLWLLAGHELYVVPGLWYAHAVHELSSWKSAPNIKDVLPPIYFRELLDAAQNEFPEYRFARYVRKRTGQAIELTVADQPAPRICVDIKTGRIRKD